MIKQKRGYSLGVLVITIAVMLIITTTALLSFKSMSGDKEITNFMNDLTEVEEYVKEYYGEKHVLPVQYDEYKQPMEITDEEYNKINAQAVENDGGKYYHVDLTKLERIHLQNKDRGYVVNENSLKIYVTEPVIYQGIEYYTVTDEMRGKDKTYNESATFEISVTGNSLTWESKMKLILSIPNLIAENSGDSFIGDGWTFKYSTEGPLTAEEFKDKGNLFLYGEEIEVTQNGIVTFYVENPNGYAKVMNIVVTKIDDIVPSIELVGDNQTSGILKILDEQTGINPDKVLYKIIGYDTNFESGDNGRDLFLYGTKYAKYIEEYNTLMTSYEELQIEIDELTAAGSGEAELADLKSRLNNLSIEINELNENNRDFNDGTTPYADTEPNIAIYLEDYAGNENSYITGISRNILLNSKLINYEAKPLDNSTFSIVKTSQYTNKDIVNLRMRSQGATNMLITMDSTISPTSLANYGEYESSNGEYEFDISTATGTEVTIYAYFTAGEYENGNLIYKAFSDTILIDKDAPTVDAPEVEISNTLELEITAKQKDLGCGIAEIEYGYSKTDVIDSYTWFDSVSEIEELIEAGEEYYIRTKATDKIGNGPAISNSTLLQCPTRKLIAIPNVPKIGNMQAITWNNNFEEIEIDATTLKDENDVTRVWYDYALGNGIDDEGISKWANAKSDDGSYWVWIPRYAYRVIYYTNSSKTDVKGYYQKSPYTGTIGYYLEDGETSAKESDVKTLYGDIDIVFLYGAEDDRYLDLETKQLVSLIEGGSKLHSEYIVHPAFKSASVGVNTLGTWGNNNLTGIWVAKFEASRDDASYSSQGTGGAVKFVPSVRSAKNVTVSEAYNYSVNINQSMNSHLMKNSEWGAVAYLAYSAYGRNGHEIKQNFSSDMITGGGTTTTGATYSTATQSLFEDRYGYKTTAAFKASTTNNIFGIYDLAGGAGEYTASYVNNGSLDSTLTSSLQSAGVGYAQLYAKGTTDIGSSNFSVNAGVYGDAIYEIATSSTKSWGDNVIDYPYGSEQIFVRGGSCNTATGMFRVDKASGAASSEITFRAVLTQ